MRLFIPTLLCLLSGTANADTPVDRQQVALFRQPLQVTGEE